MKRLHDRDADIFLARLIPSASERTDRILGAVGQIAKQGQTHWCLADTPSQTEDILLILIDDEEVVSFELPRNPVNAAPTGVERYTLSEYRDTLSQAQKRQLDLILILVRTELEYATTNLPSSSQQST